MMNQHEKDIETDNTEVGRGWVIAFLLGTVTWIAIAVMVIRVF
ncbi:hypothetical protein [Paenibacillus apiarius]|nr:hypothetical protein [Paenibacillus apiarius]MEC0118272.1 hypothetical protein [Paenibacillus apiarius]MEC0190503.1 hypothetical protein [Paenibacillus apiarius]